MLTNAGVKQVTATTSETSSTTTDTTTSEKAAGTPADFITALALDASAIYSEITANSLPVRGVAVVVDKTSKVAVTKFSNGKNYLILDSNTEKTLSSIKSNENPNLCIVVAPLTLGTAGYVSARVYSISNLMPANKNERNALVGWLGYEASTGSDISIGTNDWASFVSSQTEASA
jgi:hypothetical protein